MRAPLFAIALTLCGLPLAAQNRHTLVFNGRFDFVSLDAANHVGATTRLREFDLSIVTPGAGAVARSWLPTTAIHAMWGNGNNDGNHTTFHTWKTVFEQFNFAGPFVKYADRSTTDARNVFWTIRDFDVNKRFEVFTNNGAQRVQIRPGDFFRFRANGNTEFFVTRTLIDKARGIDRQNRAERGGASAIVQDANGDLYYSPAQGGHWVHGNNGVALPVFATDGAIVRIAAADITYDAAGNVQDVVADSAHIVIPETGSGPNGQPSIHQMVLNAGAVDRNANPIGTGLAGGTPANMVGLALDPNGGTLVASLPYGPSQTFPTIPNFVFVWDNGGYAGTIFSTAPNTLSLPGSVAVINGVKMGSDVVSVPATGAHIGVQLDVPNFQPTFMGLAIVNALPVDPFVIDAANDGAILPTDPTIDIDVSAGPTTPVYLLLAVGPLGAGTFGSSIDVSGIVAPNQSFRSFYAVNSPLGLFAGVTDGFGYLTFTLPNPNLSVLQGLTLVWQGLRPTTFGYPALSTPLLQQIK
jgi:hypothetical protein